MGAGYFFMTGGRSTQPARNSKSSLSPFPLFLTQEHGLLLAAVVASAFLGTFIGNRLAKKTTLRSIQAIVTIMLISIAIGLGSGLI
jgi:uncharacterized membrane protein YfcA